MSRHTSSLRIRLLLLFAFVLAGCTLAGCTIELPIEAPGVSPDTSFQLPDGSPWVPPGVDAGGEVAARTLTLTTVEPDRGSIAGLEKVRLVGTGFEADARVFFGDVPAPDVYVQGDGQITVRTPPHARGNVDVRVELSDGRVATLGGAFLYETAIEVVSVAPAVGPVEGGTPITVHGLGFTKGARVLVGDRVALAVEVIDDSTLLAVSPRGAAGPADVFVTLSGQVGRLRDGFLYTQAPRIDAVEPSAGPLSGGTEVRLRGTGIGGESVEVRFEDRRGDVLGVDSGGLSVRTPAAPLPGPVAVRVSNGSGVAARPAGYVYFDPDAVEPAVIGVVPGRGGTEGGTEVEVIVQGFPAGASSAEVRLGGSTAEVLGVDPEGHRLRVRTPAGSPGSADVEVRLDGAAAALTGGFVYTWSLRVDSVSPDTGPQAGGSQVIVHGAGFFDGARVRFGALPAAAVERLDVRRLRARTPPGVPGSVPVTVESGDQQATLSEGYTYVAEGLQIYLMHPTRGARAGGTYFRIVGAGFEHGTRVFVGDREALVEQEGTQLLTGYSPKGVPGLVDVRVVSGAREIVMERAWMYFDPTAFLSGTWGDPIDEAVNLTVLEAGTANPVQNAFVVLGDDPATPYQGITDMNGQATLSGPGLRGDVTATAAKNGYTAFTIAQFDAENATVYLQRLQPPQPGPPPPGQPLLPGGVAGLVHGIGKYLVAPPGRCEGNLVDDPVSGVTLCASCQVDLDCGVGICMERQGGSSFCTRSCSANGDCPGAYACANFGWSEPRCLPSPGEKSIRCFVANTSLFAGEPQILPGGVLDDEGVFSFESRLGDVAIVCQAGVVEVVGGQERFKPLVMGLRRHSFVLTEETTSDQDIVLDIPLSDRLGIRLGNPLAPADYPVRSIEAYLDLGSDGVIPIGEILSLDDRGERYVLEGMPAGLSGDLAGARLAFYVRLLPPQENNPTPYTPTAEILIDDIDPAEALRRVMLVREGGGPYEVRSIGQAPDVNGAAGDGERTFAVGSGGAILLWTGASLQVQSSPTRLDLHAVAAAGDGIFYAVGEEATVLRFDGLSWSVESTPSRARLLGVAVAPGGVFAVGRNVILHRTSGVWLEEARGFSEQLSAITVDAGGAPVAVGEHGVVARRVGTKWTKISSPSDRDLLGADVYGGRLAVVGEEGTVAIRDGGDPWVLLPPPTFDSVQAVRVLADGSVVVGAPLGRLYRWDGESWRRLDPGDHFLDVRALVGDRAGLPRLALGRHELYLGPLLDAAVVPHPSATSPLGQPNRIDWVVPEAPREAVNYLRISDFTGVPMWTIVAPRTESVSLPDLDVMAGIAVLAPGQGSIRFVRALAPGFTINNYTARDLSMFRWRSWNTLTHTISID